MGSIIPYMYPEQPVNYSWIGKYIIPMDPKWDLKLLVVCIPCKSGPTIEKNRALELLIKHPH